MTEEDRARIRRDIDRETARRMAAAGWGPAPAPEKIVSPAADPRTGEWASWVQGAIDRKIEAFAIEAGKAVSEFDVQNARRVRAETKEAIAEAKVEIIAEIREVIAKAASAEATRSLASPAERLAPLALPGRDWLAEA